MKKLLFLLSVLALMSVSGAVRAQEVENASYRRSSICLLLMDEAGMPKRDIITSSFLGAAVPEKYNDHNISIRTFDPAKLTITQADRDAYKAAVGAGEAAASEGSSDGNKKGGFGKIAKGVGGAALGAATGKGSGGSAAVDNSDKEEYAVKALKYMVEQKVAKQLFDKWFVKNGNFSMDLIRERGLYDASAMDIQTAKNSVRGMGMLEDAGEELVGQTFVVVSRFRYLSKDELVQEIDAMARLTASQVGGKYASLGADAATAAVKASLGAGYYVRTTSFLFQLEWNEEVSNTFYSQLWGNLSAYNTSDIFTVKYIGQEMAWANVKAGIFANKAESELVKMATINATDAVLAKLEREYDVFKTKTPLLTTDPITAAIGMKEGVEAGDKYEILERVVNAETGKTSYKRVSTVKVSKDQIWDNRFGASEERALSGETQDFTATKFDGDGKKLYPGLLLRQIK